MQIDSSNIARFMPPEMLDANGQVRAEFEGVKQGILDRLGTMPEADRGIFLALLTSPSFAPSAADLASNTDASLDRLENAASAISSLFGGGSVDASTLGRLLIEMTALQRQDALDSRMLARETAKTAMISEAGTLNAAAEKMRSSALTGLIMTAVASGLQVVAAGISLKGSLKGVSAEEQDLNLDDFANQANKMKLSGKADDIDLADDILKQVDDMKHLNFDAKRTADKWEFAGQVGSSFAQLAHGGARAIEGYGQADATEMQAEGKIEAAMAEHARGEADIEKEVQAALNDFIKSVIDFVKQLQEAEVNQMQAITRA